MTTDRRSFLVAMLASGVAPAFVRADRPRLAQGVAAGDLDGGRAIVWTRADRPCRILIEHDTTDRFANPTRIAGPDAVEHADFTAKLDLAGLPSGQRVFYRITAVDLRDGRNVGEPAVGSFAMPGGEPRDTTIAFTGDVCGQGWGIDPSRGGMRIFDAMHRAGPDLFVHLGDTIYADNPIVPQVRLDDGTIWQNLIIPEKSKVAETIDEFRGNYRYNLLDDHLRAFNASTAQLVLWDDHEVRNNWFPGNLHGDVRYTERSDDLLAARARAAFLDYQPVRTYPGEPHRLYRSTRLGPQVEVFAWDMRSFRGPNSANRQPTLTPESAILGATQLAWLKRALKASTATWKVIASDMPLGVIVTDGPRDSTASEAVANGDHGPPLGRELEIADLLKWLHDEKVRNVVFVTADIHYAAAHHYDPARAKFTHFNPFWEFVAGPAHAGTFGPGRLDATFGPELKFLGIPKGMKGNRPPSDGFQFFGTLRVDAKSRTLTARLHDVTGKVLYSVDLEPKQG
ncbi:MAG: alkaline phosphatase D family protein [Gemmataceae bacterium]